MPFLPVEAVILHRGISRARFRSLLTAQSTLGVPGTMVDGIKAKHGKFVGLSHVLVVYAGSNQDAEKSPTMSSLLRKLL